MVKLRALMDFRLKDFNKLKNIIRANKDRNEKGMLYNNDTFESDIKMARYLHEKNPTGLILAEIIELIPEVKK